MIIQRERMVDVIATRNRFQHENRPNATRIGVHMRQTARQKRE